MVIGAIDPLEGSVIILVGTGVATFETFLVQSRHRKILYWAFCLVAFGVAAMLLLSSKGGFGGKSGLSRWWGLTILPYPIGWILGLIGAIRTLVESRKHTSSLMLNIKSSR